MTEEMAERGIPRLRCQGQEVPLVDADVGTRYLGIHIDLMGDGAEQMAVLEGKIEEFGTKVRRARVSPEIAAYLWHAVLIPRILYPLTVMPISGLQIDRLESRALAYILPKQDLSGVRRATW